MEFLLGRLELISGPIYGYASYGRPSQLELKCVHRPAVAGARVSINIYSHNPRRARVGGVG